MEIEISTRKEDIEPLVVVGNSQVHIEDGVSTSSQCNVVIGIGRIYSHGLNCECHRFIYEDISLCS